jgi:hypothetical protein
VLTVQAIVVDHLLPRAPTEISEVNRSDRM